MFYVNLYTMLVSLQFIIRMFPNYLGEGACHLMDTTGPEQTKIKEQLFLRNLTIAKPFQPNLKLFGTIVMDPNLELIYFLKN